MIEWGLYWRSLAMLKLGEFIVCILLASVLIYIDPVLFYVKVGALGAVWGGVIFAALFFIFTLYPIFSCLLLLILIVLGVRRRLFLAAAASLSMLGYSIVWALMAQGNWPISFWIVWGGMGMGTFSLGMLLFPKGAKR